MVSPPKGCHTTSNECDTRLLNKWYPKPNHRQSPTVCVSPRARVITTVTVSRVHSNRCMSTMLPTTPRNRQTSCTPSVRSQCLADQCIPRQRARVSVCAGLLEGASQQRAKHPFDLAFMGEKARACLARPRPRKGRWGSHAKEEQAGQAGERSVALVSRHPLLCCPASVAGRTFARLGRRCV